MESYSAAGWAAMRQSELLKELKGKMIVYRLWSIPSWQSGTLLSYNGTTMTVEHFHENETEEVLRQDVLEIELYRETEIPFIHRAKEFLFRRSVWISAAVLALVVIVTYLCLFARP